MTDLISRQAAIDAADKIIERDTSGSNAVVNAMIAWSEYIRALPSAQPERKKGKWIKIPEFCGDDVSGFIDNHFSCSECKKEAEINSWGFYILSDFCPNCGADMRGGQDG